MYAIKWRSKITGKTGSGGYRLSYKTADNLRSQLDIKYPAIEHWIEEEECN